MGLDPGDGSVPLASYECARPDAAVALLVGAEGAGVSAEALAACDARVRIPMRADVDSLNVATALAIALQRLGPFGGETS